MAQTASEDFRKCKPLLRKWQKDLDDDQEDLILETFESIINNFKPEVYRQGLKEDSFVHEVFEPVIRPFFRNINFKCEWSTDVLEASVHRKRKFDRDEKLIFQYICLLESADFILSNKNKISLEDCDFVKLGNEMKDIIDKCIDDGVKSNDLIICGLLVEGFQCRLFVMDLKYEAIYRMILLGKIYLPRDSSDLGVLPTSIERLMQMKTIMTRSTEICKKNIHLSKRETIQGNVTSINEMTRPSFHTPIKEASTKDISPLIESHSYEEKGITPDPLPEIEYSSTQPESSTEPETSTTSLSQDIIHDDSAEILDFVETIHKERISSEIRERNREKKLQESHNNSTPPIQSEVSTMSTSESLDSKTVKKLWDQNQNKNQDKISQSHKKKGTENITHVIADGIQDNIISDSNYVTEISATARQNHMSGILTTTRCQNHVTEILPKILPETKASEESISSTSQLEKTLPEKQNNPVYSCVSFRKKVLDQYLDLYYEFSSENIDYYRITDETLCSLCNLDYDDDEDKICSKLYKRYKKETGLDPWIKSENSEFSQIEEGSYTPQNCVIKIFKFPEEKSIILETVHKRFPFLSYTKSNAWYRDVFKYTNSEAKCPVCKDVHTCLGIWDDWSCLGKNDHYFLNCPFRINQKKVIIAIQSLPETQVRVPNKISNSSIHPNKTRLYQYAIEHEMDPEKFSVITEAEKNRWAMGCFSADLERDIRLYRGGIKRSEDTRKYHKFLTDRDRLIGEELLRRSILKSGLSTTWLDDLMKEWEEIHTQFVQIFSQI
ncbi:133_t:CDS:10 [Ambispora gerdemannii]|uniref:133_t:CDS:1 n=1 Tax=Ambispora gerdemannii TaxID=144530 RepID=A0A9N9GV05_9GLOM|nr:133_t:CDS:10 [Ambispora gerdemannii]